MRNRISSLWILGATMAGCGSDPSGADDARTPRERAQVCVVNYPLRYFAERVADTSVDVHLLAPTDIDPAFWQPDVEDIGQFQRADLILLNGAGYAKWLAQVTLPTSRMVDTSKAFASNYVEVEDQVAHQHGPQGEHSHAGTAFTTWLDLQQAVQQARAVTDAVGRLVPEAKASLESAFQKLEGDLLAIDQDLTEVSASAAGRPLLGSHPVYQYLSRRYQLNLKSVHWEPDAAPDAAAWLELESLLEQHPARWMLWEGPALASTVKQLEERGVRCALFEPCANVPEEGDFLSVMRANVEELRRAFDPDQP